MSDHPQETAKPRRKRRTAEAITDLIIEAANAEFGKNGYSGATTAAIARKADVTEAQLFRLFASKEELFRAAIFKPLNSHFAEFILDGVAGQSRAASLRGSAHDYINALQDFMEKNSRMLMSMVAASAYSPVYRQQVSTMDGMQAYFDRGAALMTRRVGADAEVDPQLMVRVSFAAVLGATLFKDWLFPPGVSEESIRHAIAAFVTSGVDIHDGG
ncbi:MAG TPA: helix-turn-helix domain-containing protein [Sphingobium sp.]